MNSQNEGAVKKCKIYFFYFTNCIPKIVRFGFMCAIYNPDFYIYIPCPSMYRLVLCMSLTIGLGFKPLIGYLTNLTFDLHEIWIQDSIL